MNCLAFVPTKQGQATKAGLEAISYAARHGAHVTALVVGPLTGDGGMGSAGASNVLHVTEDLQDEGQIARAVAAAAQSLGASLVVAPHDHVGRAVAPRVAVRLKAGLVPGVTSPVDGNTFQRNVFSGKAMAHVQVHTDVKVVTTTPNAFGADQSGATAAVEVFGVDAGPARLKVTGFESSSEDGSVPLPEAVRVVSAGRGLKGPEHWGIVEDLAKALGATTACSRPVSDMGWRPHHEHVGQTGITIRPDLYIAAGISGAIQHLAGVNQSKVIVAINTDPEAPFFKAADYGIVGDAFEVLPKLTAAVQNLG
ncbi:MAG: electron transfer flavoprotein subunit alpha/FixB family protein [Bacteroidetes bacterium]|nr:electron transfer flavoprotein subunit alpha/FixB family protein [Bacteroidota bacterium]MDA0903530.1 electron transfer flavoprotein subunit alpha/FixB family protein [Bacteroidota bacterium]MDA1241885.1 electron transfer flavoprotein subunit alpha/FixB family protein [Bacteroidota bacterium]